MNPVEDIKTISMKGNLSNVFKKDKNSSANSFLCPILNIVLEGHENRDIRACLRIPKAYIPDPDTVCYPGSKHRIFRLYAANKPCITAIPKS